MIFVWLLACATPETCEAGALDDYCTCDGGYPGARVCDNANVWTPCSCEIGARPDPEGEETLPGESTYWSYCSPCHGNQGTGTGTGPSLVDRIPGMTDDQVFAVIREGKGNMPAFRSFTDDKVDELVVFLRTEFGE